MAWMLTAYWVCLVVGIGYTILAFLLGGLGGHGADFSGHAGDFSHSYGIGGHGGHGTASGSGDSGQITFGPFSPLVIAFFLTCFGATGVVLMGIWNARLYISLPIAFVASFLLGWALIIFLNRLLGNLQGSSEIKLFTLVGTEAEVTVEIPVSGIGEIAYIAMGSRNVAPARSEEKSAIPRFAGVRITRLVGNMFYVSPLVEEQLRDLDGATVTSQDPQ